MQDFKNGIKRLRVAHAPEAVAGSPFRVLSREPAGSEETWVVRGWEPRMAAWVGAANAELKEVVDLDLEEGFVELLRASRAPAA
jgi:hypothetical protein